MELRKKGIPGKLRHALLISVLWAFMTPALVAGEDLAGAEAGSVSADTNGQQNAAETARQEESHFSNAAQAQHAAALAAAAAAAPNQEVAAALDREAAAERALAEAAAQDNPQALEAARVKLAAAREEADRTMAENAGVTKEDIAGMREEGMGWGQIAHELGVQPGALGLGHAKAKKGPGGEAGGSGRITGAEGGFGDPEISKATARNLETGWSKGHGVNAGNNSGSKSLGLDKAGRDSATAKAGGSGGPGSGNSSGRGNGGAGRGGNDGGGGNSGGGKGGGGGGGGSGGGGGGKGK